MKLLMQKFPNFSKGVIVNITREPSDYVSRIFTRNEEDDNYRMILNLKMFNEF